MLNMKSQYINLDPDPIRNADAAERKYFPETRKVHLSGKLRKLFRDRANGITIMKSDRASRTPIFDLKRIFRLLLYGLGFGVVLTGVVFLIDKRDGEKNG